VPHASDGAGPTRAVGPWRLSLGDRRWSERVGEEAVVAGTVIHTGPPALP
jgi:hypothetical protein